MEDGIRSGETFFSSDSSTRRLGALGVGVLGLSNLTLLGPKLNEKTRGVPPAPYPVRRMQIFKIILF